ncbi:TetR/AcrR family transcriptional regulator [Pseudomonas sp. B392_1p]|uniref:TetR/AcrR family transcriptional regulator n=1 Tax=Pseudomonas sp. B392_1p TaxID=3457507 RepID=UPI003FD34CF9
MSEEYIPAESNKVPSGKYNRRRQEILLAAAAVFAEQGFHGCRTQDIADRLGLKQASLYYYFPTKEAALEAVCLYAVSEATMRLRPLLEDTAAALADKIRRVIHAYLHDMKAHRDCMIVLTEQRRHLPPEQQASIRVQAREYRTLLLQLFDEARARGEIRSDVDCALSARALTDLCHCAALRLQREPEREREHHTGHIIEQYTRLFCTGIQSEQRPPHPCDRAHADTGARDSLSLSGE